MKVLFGFFLIALLGGSLGQLNVPGPCRTLPAVDYFDVVAYQGVWYELQRYNHASEEGIDCVTADYNINDEIGGIDIINAGVALEEHEYFFIEGRGEVSFPDEWPVQGFLNVSFFGGPTDTVNYQVVETDYENYAFVWNCEDQDDGTSNEYAWIMARAYEVTGDQQGRVDELIAEYLDESELRQTVQDQEICLGEGPAPAS